MHLYGPAFSALGNVNKQEFQAFLASYMWSAIYCWICLLWQIQNLAYFKPFSSLFLHSQRPVPYSGQTLYKPHCPTWTSFPKAIERDILKVPNSEQWWQRTKKVGWNQVLNYFRPRVDLFYKKMRVQHFFVQKKKIRGFLRGFSKRPKFYVIFLSRNPS